MRFRSCLAFALALTSAACSQHRTDVVSPADVPVTVAVVNNNALPVEVYISSAGSLHRLGTVHPGMTGRFTVPPAFVGGRSVEFQANNTGGGTYRSGSLLLAPGEIIDVSIAAQMFSSTTTVRP
jgi:hypothetical protein